MGTLLNRRRYMGGGGGIPPASSYIQDGLIFQLDGWEKGSKTSQLIWTDLIGGLELAANGAGMVFDTNCVYNTSSNYVMKSSTKLATNADHTIEIAMIPRASALPFWNGNSTANNIVVYVNMRNSYQFMQHQKGWLYTMTLGNKYTASANLSYCVINGEEITTLGASDWWASSDDLGLAGRGFVGTWYAVRVYNRRLTAAEMLFNQKLDNQRFNLGLTI